jgi:hypothetical protein
VTGQIGITLDGVIRRITDQSVPNPNGLMLFEGLKQFGRVTFLADGFVRDQVAIEHFLKIHRITGHVGIDVSVLSDGGSIADRRLAQIFRMRRNGPISLVIEPDPKIAAALLAEGVPTLLYLHPQYSVPSWRPDYNGSPRRWDDLVAETDRQNTLRAEEDSMERETL